MSLYKNKYRVESIRLQNWDYGRNGKYFITTITKNRQHYFGEIKNNEMYLSNIGVIADVMWHEITNHANDVELDAFVVMPNHIHGILILKNNDESRNGGGNRVNGNDRFRRDNACVVSTNKTNDITMKTIGQQRFQNQGKNTISSIIGGYKSAVSKHTHHLGYEFGWQSRFHDHIIKNDVEYERIKKYIIDNPINWNDDKFYDKKIP